MSDEVLTGRCLCGAVRYQVEGLPVRVSHCHCEQCRRAGGGVAMTFAGFETAKVIFEGAMKQVRPTEFATREFCPECGSHLTFRFDERPDYVAIPVGTLVAVHGCETSRCEFMRPPGAARAAPL